MIKQRFYLVTLVLLFAAACASQPNPPAGYDYCYKFDFKAANTFNVVNGDYVSGQGYFNDDNGNLSLNFNNGGTVNPLRIFVGIQRITAGDITARANGIVFGLAFDTGVQTIPAATSSTQLQFDSSDAGANSPTANVSAAASGRIAVTDLTIYGRGASPFGTPNCGDFIPSATVLIPTGTAFPTIAATATLTRTPTITFTPTATSTITPTPTATTPPTWCYTFDFTASNGSWTTSGVGNGSYSGSGWSAAYQTIGGSGPSFHVLNISRTFTSTNITFARMEYTYTAGTLTNGTGDTTVGLWYTDYTHAIFQSLTNAHLSSPQQNASLNITTTKLLIQLMTGNQSGTSDPGGSAVLTKLVLKGNGTSPFGDNCSPTATPTYTPTITYTPSITTTPAATSTFLPTSTPTFPPTWTPNPLVATGTRTPNPSRTPIPIYVPPTRPPRTNTPAPTSTPGAPTQTQSANATGTANAQATGTATVGGTPTPNTTGNANATGTANALGTATGVGTAIADSGAGQMADLGQAAVGSAGNVMAITFRYLTGLSTTLKGITDAWYNTAPEAPPMLPHCKSHPLDSELCAIYYILTYTVFSGTTGTLLIPIGTVIVDLFILFSAVKFIRALLSRAAKIIQ